MAFGLSFFDVPITMNHATFVGWDNFVEAFHDPRFINSLKVTAIFTGIEVPVQVLGALVIAAFISKNNKRNKFLRAVYFLPVICSATVIGIMWRMILHSNIGFITAALQSMGLGKINFMNTPGLTIFVISFISIWRSFGISTIIYVTAIQQVSPSLFEAAQMDGAGKILQFLHITVPSIRPTFWYIMMTRFAGALQIFDIIYVTTNGGPNYTTESTVSYIYSRAFSSNSSMGYASAMSVVLFIIIMFITVLIQNRLHIPVTVAIASEFRYEEPVINEKSMVIVVSQSGETIDTLEALRLANKYTKKTLSIVNVKGSSIARESSYVLYTHAGPEIAVASTKAYTVQVASFYLLACKLAMKQQKISVEEARTFIGTLQEIPNYIEEVLAQAPDIEQLTKRMINANNAFFIGRGLDYTLCMEGALKLKEISYIHAEAYAAGELKHGTIALVSEGVPVIAAATQKHVYSKVISNIREVKARGAYVILLSKDKEITDPSICDVHINLPDVSDEFTIFESVVIFQLIAYYISVGKGLNPDQPRNLAKSVTVE